MSSPMRSPKLTVGKRPSSQSTHSATHRLILPTMPPKIAVVQDPEDESWAGLCQGPGCGPYSTRGWPTKAIATERIRQHEDEHLSLEENPEGPFRLMEDLGSFREKHGLIQSETSGKMAVFPKGVKPLKPASSGADSGTED